MKFLPYLLKHLRRNWFRTGLTVVAMAVCIFLFCTLQSVLAQIDALLEATSANRLVTRHSVSLIFDLPLAYENRILGVDGVRRVAVNSWFGGSLPAKKEEKGADDSSSGADFSNFFTNMAVEPEPFFAMFPEYEVPPEQFQAFTQDLRGCVIGEKLAERYGWKIGDIFYLESFIPEYRKPDGPFEFVVRGIYRVDPVKHPNADQSSMYFNFKYLYEATGRNVRAGTFMVEIEDPDRAGDISAKIDALFANSDAPTRTETEQAFLAGFISLAGNLALLLNGIGIAVTFTILLVVANTMSIAVRERRTEIAVLKTLGFTSGKVMGLVVAESLLLGALGGLLGIGGARGMLWILTHTPAVRGALAGIGLAEVNLQPVVALLGFAVALFLGFAAGIVPALGAYRARITEMLRTV